MQERTNVITQHTPEALSIVVAQIASFNRFEFISSWTRDMPCSSADSKAFKQAKPPPSVRHALVPRCHFLQDSKNQTSRVIFRTPSGGGVQFPIAICGPLSTFFGKHFFLHFYLGERKRATF
jgi:hypothetical protein